MNENHCHFVIAHNYFTLSRGTAGASRRNPGWEALRWTISLCTFIIHASIRKEKREKKGNLMRKRGKRHKEEYETGKGKRRGLKEKRGIREGRKAVRGQRKWKR